MENPNEFDLNYRLRQWNAKLAAQPGLTPEARKELEIHLNDTIGELRERGLNTEEAFWLACRRIGALAEVGEEFAKSNPIQHSMRPALCIGVALLAAWLIQGTLSGISGALGMYELHYLPRSGPVVSTVQLQNGHVFNMRHMSLRETIESAPWWVEGLRNGLQNEGSSGMVAALTVILMTVFLVRQRPEAFGSLRQYLFESRLRFGVIAFVLVNAIVALNQWSANINKALLVLNPDWPLTIESADLNSNVWISFFIALTVLIGTLMLARIKNSLSKIFSAHQT